MYVLYVNQITQSPSLITAESKDQFIQRLLPPNQEHVTAEMNIPKVAADILEQLGNGLVPIVVEFVRERNRMINSLSWNLILCSDTRRR